MPLHNPERPTYGLLAAILVLSSTLTGCMVGPNYKRPDMPNPAAYRFAETAQAESMADAPWFRVFDDPALQALIKEAITNNLDVRAAAARVEEARARAGIANSFLYPQIDGVASYGGRGGSSEESEGASQNGTFGFQLSWELDLWGRIRREKEAALAVVLATEQGRRAVLVTLVADVASQYFLLRELDLQLEIARATLKLNDDTVTYFRNRLEGGVSNRLEVDRIVALRAETAAAIPAIETQIAVVENALSLLLGRPPATVGRTLLSASEALPPPIPPGLPAQLLERRPDVVQAEQLLVAANADIGAAKALFYPTINLTGFFGGVSGDLSTFLGVEGAVWSAGVSLFQPLYNGGRLKSNLQVMEARFTAAIAEYQKAALNAYREVANSLITIQKLAEIRAQREVGVEALRDASELARTRYDSGLASYIEILTADQDFFQQQLLLAQTRGAELRARAELYRTLGGGWQEK
jgi:multidrug efflux system outer membrane protein